MLLLLLTLCRKNKDVKFVKILYTYFVIDKTVGRGKQSVLDMWGDKIRNRGSWYMNRRDVNYQMKLISC